MRRPRVRQATLCVLALLAAAVASRADVVLPASVAAHTNAGGEILGQAYVPDASRRVGEVRLLRNQTTRIAQTLLYTKLMRRVVSEITRKERDNWPEERPGHTDAARYLAALEAAAASLPKPKTGERSADRRQRLLIEFIDAADITGIVFSRFEGEEVDGVVRISTRTPIAWLPAERAYVATNVDLITADALHLGAAKVQELWKKDSQVDR